MLESTSVAPAASVWVIRGYGGDPRCRSAERKRAAPGGAPVISAKKFPVADAALPPVLTRTRSSASRSRKPDARCCRRWFRHWPKRGNGRQRVVLLPSRVVRIPQNADASARGGVEFSVPAEASGRRKSASRPRTRCGRCQAGESSRCQSAFRYHPNHDCDMRRLGRDISRRPRPDHSSGVVEGQQIRRGSARFERHHRLLRSRGSRVEDGETIAFLVAANCARSYQHGTRLRSGRVDDQGRIGSQWSGRGRRQQSGRAGCCGNVRGKVRGLRAPANRLRRA